MYVRVQMYKKMETFATEIEHLMIIRSGFKKKWIKFLLIKILIDLLKLGK